VTLAPLNTTAEELELFAIAWADRPVPVQYVDFTQSGGDFGSSFRYHEPAMGVVPNEYRRRCVHGVAALR
jgi:ABC-type dipeptide/oligopeptide/nickel transport system permease component